MLGGILLNPKEALNRVLELLEPEDFYSPAHQEIFAAILGLEETSEAHRLITLEEQLRATDKLARIGGVVALAELASRVPTAENIGYHAHIVRDKATLRRLIRTAIGDRRGGLRRPRRRPGVPRPRRAADLRAGPAHHAAAATSPSSRSWPTPSTPSPSATSARRRSPACPPGFADFDKMTAGLQRSDLIIIAARPSVGKTAFCLNIAQNTAMDYNVPVLVFSLEMSKESLIERILCSEARVDSSKLRSGFLDQNEWMNLTRAAGRIAEAPIYIDDSAAPTVLEIRAKARRFRADKSIFTEPDQMGLIIVDYLQLVRSHTAPQQPGARGGRGQPRAQGAGQGATACR